MLLALIAQVLIISTKVLHMQQRKLRCDIWRQVHVTTKFLSSSSIMISAEDKRDLTTSSIQARQNAYCPYSSFPVGAAVLVELKKTGEKKIFTGAC